MPLLYVFRHAKSSWADTGLRDFERPLANRGLKAAPKMGALMQERVISPDHILCSTSRRTRETLGLVLPYLQGESRISMENSLYEARSEAAVIERLRRLPAHAHRVMIIGHNPIMQDLTLTLVKDAKEPQRLAAATEKFPTAGLAILDLGDTAWSAIQAGCGRLNDFVVPRELPAGRF